MIPVAAPAPPSTGQPGPGPRVGGDADHALTDVWEDDPGLPGFFTTVDHKRIGIRYLVTAVIFLLIGGIEASVIRLQLATPNGSIVGANTYDQIMTMHGTTMIFLFNTPVFAGFGNYLVPLQIGARDMAFPRLNALSYWIYVMAGLFMYGGFAIGEVPNGGWFAYTPLTASAYSPGRGLDFWALGITFLGIATTVGGINFIVTIFRMRAPGMSFNRLPLFCWGILTMSFMIVFALPAITLAGALLEMDRTFHTRFFDVAHGGAPLLYQHLFWIWGHPEVYILFIPATGIISMIIPTFVRHRIVGYPAIAASLVATGFISFGLWVHHMFATGTPMVVASFFSMASMVVAIPSGVQIFAWLATLLAGEKVRFEPPLLFAVGFIVIFVIGGMSGVMVGVVPFDQAVTDSYFVVAHFHYVLIGGTMFPVFAGLYYWFPKFTGRLLHRGLGIASFWFMFIGTNVTFFPQHLLGFDGMPRRIYTYASSTGWGPLNLLSSIGAGVLVLGVAASVVNFAHAWRRGPQASADPWGGETLEWAVESPPPPHNFEAVPVVGSGEPMWDLAPGTRLGTLATVDDEDLTRPAHRHHRAWLTSPLDATEPEMTTMPGPTWWPFVLALGMLVVCVGIAGRAVVVDGIGLALMAFALVRWHDVGGS
ncbi:MAG TPA: cytochrome c oxidase subunit I [Acidimicrobiales bacterium]|nr:cytochrome c oxidase subunit I [Acidimicrobiales bacterium]